MMRESVGTAGQGTGTNVADPEQPQVVSFREAFRRYVPVSEVEAFKADLAARRVKEVGGEKT